jgi:anti-anti-sigma regulatory factor
MKVRVSQDSQGSVVVLSGDVDERVSDGLREITAKAKATDVTFDCEGVQNINSIGMRQWMMFMASFGAQRKLTFRRCPSALIDYAVIIPKLFGSGRVESFYMSY